MKRDFVQDLKVNPKAFWRYTGTSLKTKSRIEDLHSGEVASTNLSKAEALNNYFGSVFVVEDTTILPRPTNSHSGACVDRINVAVEEVERKLRGLKPCSAPGPDGFHPRFLRESAQALASPVAALFRKSLTSGSIPLEWKLGEVTPIFKKGDKKSPSNYRPVSLTSVLCKTLESIVRDRLLDHLHSTNQLNDAQHGFRPKRSCATQLLITIENWSKALEAGEPVDSLYLDFSKAFDSVPHKRLIRKVESFGVRGQLLTWIEAFLTDRQQRVVIQGSKSGWAPVTSGVPQGSVLGPILFLLFVNDLPDAVQSHVQLFADDTKLYRSIVVPDDSLLLQRDLDALVHWSDTWQLPFNEAKCKFLHFGRTSQQSAYTMRGSLLEQVQTERDLGVHMDVELKFRKHAATAVSKASQVLAVIRRSFMVLDRTTLPLLYKTLVRPHLEYCNVVWGPFNRADQKLVERVQRRATKLVEDVRSLPYPERLRALGLPSLYYRRQRGDMIMVYQILHSGVDLDPEVFFSPASTSSTRGHLWKLQKPQAQTRIRRNAFCVRVVNHWNSLPLHVVAAASVNQFKSKLDAHWTQHIYSIPD